MSMHPKASELLIKICCQYNQSNKTKFHTADFGIKFDDYFQELEANNYLTLKNDIAGSFEISERTIAFAHSLK